MAKVMFISSMGGHLNELTQLDFQNYDFSIVTEKTDATRNIKEKYRDKAHFLLYGTRKTPIRYFFILLFNFFKSLVLFLKIRPQVVVTTGTHTAVSMCYIAKMFGAKVIWIETFANRTSKTLAGRLVYPIADTFVVQWKEMQNLYPKAKHGELKTNNLKDC